MAQKTDADLTIQADVIRNEAVAGANTKGRVADMAQDIIDSKANNTALTSAVDAAVAALVNAAPATLDTFDELATALGDDPNLAATLIALIGTKSPKVLIIACSDETTALSAGAGRVTFRMPYAMTVTGVKASLTTAQTSGNILTVDIHDSGTTILSTKLTIDNGEKTSATALAAAVISDTALAADAEITIDIDQIGDGTAKGLKVTITGT